MSTMATRLRAERPLFSTASTAPLGTPVEMVSRVLSAG